MANPPTDANGTQNLNGPYGTTAQQPANPDAASVSAGARSPPPHGAGSSAPKPTAPPPQGPIKQG